DRGAAQEAQPHRRERGHRRRLAGDEIHEGQHEVEAARQEGERHAERAEGERCAYPVAVIVVRDARNHSQAARTSKTSPMIEWIQCCVPKSGPKTTRWLNGSGLLCQMSRYRPMIPMTTATARCAISSPPGRRRRPERYGCARGELGRASRRERR